MKNKIVTKKNIFMLFMLIVFLGSMIYIGPTYAKFTNSYTTEDNIAEFNYDFNLSVNNLEEYEIVKVSSNDYSIFNIEVSNDTNINIYYGIWYKMINSNVSNDIKIAKYVDSENDTFGEISSNKSKIITVIVINNSSDTLKLKIGISSSKEDVNSIEYLGGKKLISGVLEKPQMEANIPNLDVGMIPVSYSENSNSWVKADKENNNGSWYNYNSKKWANAVLVNSNSRESYQNAKVGTTIDLTDILAFYVWIPRFKYHVWNVNRQVGDENTYAYASYSKGIDIKWETGTKSTGNLSCNYGNDNANSDDSLADSCIYNGNEVIINNSDNKKYKDVWYTHPAFTYGDKELTGFWVGKFETTGTEKVPTILPDNKALVNKNISTQFTIAKIFQNYGLTANVDAHMLKNIEWGAVAYLTYSNYGLCDNSSCRDLYVNNSADLYTGRSGGAVAGSTDLSLNKIYQGITDSIDKYNKNGYYDYQGYFIDYQGNVTTTRNITKVASTTGNVYGIYDMAGGAMENVLGNTKNSSNKFNLMYSGNLWNGQSELASKYYDSYAYAENVDSKNMWTRARLGDATIENTVKNNSLMFGWKPGFNIIGTDVSMGVVSYPWIVRGGKYFHDGAGLFNFNNYDGGANNENTFRSSLS